AGRAFTFCLETESKQRIQGFIKIPKNYLKKLKELKLAQPHLPPRCSNINSFLTLFKIIYLTGF
ncbi:MAG: hypothetical protein KAK04_23565, partial [Cyclobacteriaceae bacterium]|nr:hypothetical protein [Cyclobacteriaceae bacterium]